MIRSGSVVYTWQHLRSNLVVYNWQNFKQMTRLLWDGISVTGKKTLKPVLKLKIFTCLKFYTIHN